MTAKPSHITASRPLHPIDRTLDAQATAVEDVRVDHRRADVSVAEQFLDGANVVARLEQMRRERMEKCGSSRAWSCRLGGLPRRRRVGRPTRPGRSATADRSARRGRSDRRERRTASTTPSPPAGTFGPERPVARRARSQRLDRVHADRARPRDGRATDRRQHPATWRADPLSLAPPHDDPRDDTPRPRVRR